MGRTSFMRRIDQLPDTILLELCRLPICGGGTEPTAIIDLFDDVQQPLDVVLEGLVACKTDLLALQCLHMTIWLPRRPIEP